MTNSRTMFGWALVGLVFIINAFIASHCIDDGGFVADVSALLATLILLVPMVTSIVADLRAGAMRMHELAVLAVLASFMQGELLTSACIALFMLLSMVIETRAASGARMSLEALARISPGKARRVELDGSESELEGHELNIGDRIRVRPGESILADGVVVRGYSSVNEANITGESLPVDKAPDSPVFAGTSNVSGVLEVRVERAGEDTTIGKVRELILRAQESRLPFVRMIDAYVRYYTPLVLTVAATVLYFTRHYPDGFSRVVALLVASCPIALILATPAAVVAALSSAARLGVLFKDVNDIEALTRINAFIFDKTGTLTTGHLEVTQLCPCAGVETTDLVRVAATAESGSNHPIARAVHALAKKVNLHVEPPAELHEEPGRGVRVRGDKGDIVVGNLPWIEANGIAADEFSELERAQAMSASLLFVAENGKALGWLAVSDRPRPDAENTLTELGTLGIQYSAIVSGDRQPVVERVAGELGVTQFQGECTPAAKVEFVEHARQQGDHVVFVGDGVNDGPALAASTIGIAMGAAGSDVAIESAPVALMNNELNRLPFLLTLARRMKAAILQNFAIGGLIVVGGIFLGATGRLSPMIAAALQVAGALVVAMNSARLIRHGEEIQVMEITSSNANATSRVES